MTYIDKLPVSFTGADVGTLPVYKADPILETGSMFLVEPALTFASGIPTDGTAVKNIAADKLTARGYDPTLAWFMDSNINDGVTSKIERTSLGGVHNILSKTNVITPNTGAGVLFPSWFAQYIVDNAAHTFAWSVWGRVTQTGPASASQVVSQLADTTSTGLASVPYLGFANTQAVGSFLLSKTATPASPSYANLMANRKNRVAFNFGRAAGLAASSGLPSYVLYRLTVEDLTVTGRTYSAFQTVDNAQYTAAFAVGGRYYNDTNTAPSTLA